MGQYLLMVDQYALFPNYRHLQPQPVYSNKNYTTKPKISTFCLAPTAQAERQRVPDYAFYIGVNEQFPRRDSSKT